MAGLPVGGEALHEEVTANSSCESTLGWPW